ncbi:TetR/AcrR family transcriptional regulator [Brachybacterium sp. AOP43-C2-M15]|uniref:TetR/AcrR family transcriptional regulator n=1 Tax=Brachybacterium sp. AOP43-C2-M15 TaxID=3457661 RepID=UPI0040342C73
MPSSSPPPSRAGRPVDPARRRAVLEAAGELLGEQPYDEVTIEQIAERAGVGKQLLYRVWGSKAEVVAQAVLQGTFALSPEPVPDTGDLRADLESWLLATAEAISAPSRRSVARALATASAGGPDRRELFDEVLTRPAGAVVVERLERARAAGATTPSAPAEVIADLLTGYIALATLGSVSLAPERLHQVLDAVLPGDGAQAVTGLRR